MKKIITTLAIALTLHANAQSIIIDTLVKNSNLSGFLLHYGTDSASVSSYTATPNTWGTGAGIEPFRVGSVPNYSNVGGSGLVMRKSTSTGAAAGLLDTIIYNTSNLDSIIVGAFLNLSSGDSVNTVTSLASGYYVLNNLHNSNHNASIYIPIKLYIADNVPLAINELNIISYSHTSGAGILQVKNTSIDVGIYPNPSHGNMTIQYILPAGVNKGEVVVYNAQGVQVKTYTVDRTLDSLLFSNSELATGTYFYQLKTDKGSSDTKKILIIK